MAMAGRIRSSLPLLSRLMAAADSLSGQRCALSRALSRALLCPTFSKAEVLRNYSTDLAKKGDKVKVPLVLYGGSGNYASALYLAAVKANALDKVEPEFVDLVVASERSPTFTQFMKDLTVPANIRVKAITAICDEAKFSEVTKKFLVLLAENGRLRYLDDIVKKFRELTMAHRGEVKAIVTTVIPLPPEEEKELKETLQDVIGKGKKVLLEQKIDPSILGGLVVEFDMKVFDMSIATRAKQMERFLREPITDVF